LEAVIVDLEQQLENQVAEATEAIGSWESRCSEIQEGFDSNQADLANCKVELVAALKSHADCLEHFLVSYDDNYESELHAPEDANLDAIRFKISTKQKLLNDLLANKENYINHLFEEMEKLRESREEEPSASAEENDTLKEQIEDLLKEIAEKQSTIDSLQNSSTNEQGTASHVDTDYAALESKITSLEMKIGSLQQEIDEERFAKEAFEAELWEAKDKLSKFVHSESMVKSELEELKAENAQLQRFKAELENAKAEDVEQQDSLRSMKASEGVQYLELSERISALEQEKEALEEEVERLSKHTNELQDDLQDANNAMQVYVAKEVSDRATALAAHALREQLHEIRKQADADRAAYEAEKEARLASESEVERLRSDLFALVDITDQENELYGAAALTIKAADKIHRKERSEITELRKSLTRALEELREARSAEKDAEERAAKAAHHVIVCEQELSAAKSDMKYLIQTMDEMRQDEASRRASLEHRIRTLENDHEVLRRFHSSETDSLRNELTQAVMERDRTLQLLKDSEKNNAAMVYAASKEHPASPNESPEAELARLRIEKAQLIVAAAEEGERTERRLREVIATEVSSAEADVLVERERRLAAEAACNNMKLLVVELQKDVQAYKNDINLGSYSPRKAQMEQENERLKRQIADLSSDNESLRSRLTAAESAQENANYRIEKLEAECRIAQASSNRLDREIKFHSEVQLEMSRMRTSPQVVKPTIEETPKEGKTEDDLRTVELYDKIHEQAEAMKKAREVHHALQAEHEDLLALLAQQEEVKRSLENALARVGGQRAVEDAIREAEENSIAQYGHSVRVVSTPE
jgi:phage regulator Rha-like protein